MGLPQQELRSGRFYLYRSMAPLDGLLRTPQSMSLVVGYDTEHDRDEPMAREIVNTLVTSYPGHGWFVLIKGGVVQVKNLDWSDKYGMVLHYSQLGSDANDRKKQIVRAAGEFLERAQVKRGGKTEQVVKHIEGIPDKHVAR